LFSTSQPKPATLRSTGPTLKSKAPTLPPPGEHPARAMVDNALNHLDNRKNLVI
jgi:hypothetical protein